MVHGAVLIPNLKLNEKRFMNINYLKLDYTVKKHLQILKRKPSGNKGMAVILESNSLICSQDSFICLILRYFNC